VTNRAYGYHREEIKMRAVFMVASFAVPTIYFGIPSALELLSLRDKAWRASGQPPSGARALSNHSQTSLARFVFRPTPRRCGWITSGRTRLEMKGIVAIGIAIGVL
jgi:hypothetical protein